LPEVIRQELHSVDLVIHAGDFTEAEVYHKLNSLVTVIAVHGNMDVSELRRLLPDKLITTVNNIKIGIIHGSGSPQNILQSVRSEFDGVDIIIFGHSHTPVNEAIDDVHMFNPGSSTEPRCVAFCSYGIIEIANKSFSAEIFPV